MIIAHLADLHLGYRAYHRVTARGVNAREADVAEAFRRAGERLVELRPDLVLVAGDIFHTVRPSNSAIAEAFRQFVRVTTRLPEVPVVLIAGNHDSPRSTDTGNILALFREIPGLLVVTEEAERLRIPALDASVLCLPHNALAWPREEDDARSQEEDGSGRPQEGDLGRPRGGATLLEPDPDAGTNVLMLHGTVSGAAAEGKIRYVSEYGGVAVADTAIGPERWDYVALGHYHIATELAPNMWYAGGLERTSTNVWLEAEGPKGFLTYDTERRAATFHPLPTRDVVDLARLPARGLTTAEVDQAIADAVEGIPGGLAGKIVRLVVTDIPRHVVRELDHRRIREYKAEALHFHLDPRPPEVRRVVGSGAPMRRQTLREQVVGYLERWTPTSPAIERERLVALGRAYLDEVGEEGE
jgi:DNA repair protein SbcD/Mre11